MKFPLIFIRDDAYESAHRQDADGKYIEIDDAIAKLNELAALIQDRRDAANEQKIEETK